MLFRILFIQRNAFLSDKRPDKKYTCNSCRSEIVIFPYLCIQKNKYCPSRTGKLKFKSKKICRNCFSDIKTKLKPKVYECLELFEKQQPIETFDLKRDYHSYKKVSLYQELRYI
ncbi:hypothetical protein AAA799N04_00407 [Marine Group I thaumarchaeote SCGC AAA799-N04]|uniref:Uncharacterized protein n=1 Tax=Marine Group I thaumarchaeote SCGC AAA799-N04 TaxID=1502293 RepID=A0A081RPK4_9ARCH|nr:hypothetical protein AAA799N04_00407 [Marine Group I thaumarchaeote SCGC AAA799-N04]